MTTDEWNKYKTAKNILYSISFDDKVYYGITTGPLQSRISRHISDSLNPKPFQNYSEIYRQPYGRFKGIQSHIRSYGDSLGIPSSITQRALRNSIRTNLRSQIEVIAIHETKASLREAEKELITKHWIRNPKTLLNYADLPIHNRLIKKTYKNKKLDALLDDPFNIELEPDKETQIEINKLIKKLSRPDWDAYYKLVNSTPDERLKAIEKERYY